MGKENKLNIPQDETPLPVQRKRILQRGQTIRDPQIRRLARRAGVVRMSKLSNEQIRGLIKERLSKIAQVVVSCVDNSNRKTVTKKDVLFVLSREGEEIYGA